MPFPDYINAGRRVYVTDWGVLPITDKDIEAAGARFTKTGALYGKNAWLLHDFMTLLAKDELMS